MSTHTTAALSDDDSVEQEMVQLIANSAHRVPAPVFILAACLAVIGAGRLPLWVVGSWFALAVGVIALRLYVFRSLPNRTDLTSAQRFDRVIYLNILGGVTYSLTLIGFPEYSDAERAFATMVLIGLCTCAVTTTSCKPVGAYAYTGPIMAGMALAWALTERPEGATFMEKVIPVLVILYAIILVGLAKEVNRAIVESWTIRLRERDLNNQLQAALRTAENASNAKTRFLAAASHDLRQPLHTISTLGAALSLRPADERSRQIIDFLNTVTTAFAEQLDGLLDISKLDAGVVEANRKPVKLSTLLQQHMAEISEHMAAKRLQPMLQCDTDDAADTDPMLFLRVLRNLTQNAIKFTDQGSIGLSLRRVGPHLEVVVSDTGRGIPPDQQDKVFQEFYQVGNPERDRSQGLGLGLSIVHRLVAMLDIQMTMRSVPGHGTQFTLLLPVATGVVLPEPVPEPPPAQPVNMTVLVVDDEKAVRTGLRILLEELECNCIEASGTRQAAQVVKHTRPDLVLADFRLRGTDSGIDTIAAVRTRWPDVYAVLVSGDTAPDRLQEAQRAGIRLIHKPLALDTLRHLLASAGHTATSVTAQAPSEEAMT